jgi:hypothetical protein
MGPWDARSRYRAERLRAWAARHDAGFINLLPAIERGAAEARLYYEKDGHCTAAGHAVIADELFHYLVDRGLVP